MMDTPKKTASNPFTEIRDAAKSILEGMSVTLAEMTRYLEGKNHTTVQYPDRTRVPVADTLPERYRGFLEIDLDICTGCKACERDCPINCIAINLEKVEGGRAMTRFDIDMGKCMYCGICVESCPIEGQAPGDAEPTKAIRMTREFEAATAQFSALTFRFIRPGDQVQPFKPKKGVTETTRRRGEIAREARKKAAEHNALAVEWALDHGGLTPSAPVAETVAEPVVAERAAALAPRVREIMSDKKALAELLSSQAFAQTDCGACGWPTCNAYAEALLVGGDGETYKCEANVPAATRDATLLVALARGATPDDAARAARRETLRRHR